ncbi:NAD-dependent protein deacetylase, SIR2 family [Paenibacillus sp. yr247]|uniref:SIR2 family NAD-dependent protein deacylase n=1 Tax=Paenibacillus sp. yr247 TaxID=1761880 RepID=UPI00088B7466|nr:NAD-dependent deacylase [Paenibacillus sp. yr247]SDN61084.1 NAD-dependent protein deacetylase, SIR2 family [Paenibacillus sp. yr247]
MNEEKKIIVSLGFEGGEVTLWGRRNSLGSWKYATGRNESALADLLFDEDADLLPVLVREPVQWVDSFDEAIGLLEKYSWRRAYPSHVHPDFRELVWNQVIAKRPPSRNLFRWVEACEVEIDKGMVTLADWIQNSKFTVILSGAGLSTASGIPDFRSGSGWWNNIDPTTVATADAMKHNYETFHAFYSFRIHALEGLLPNQSHQILAKWERHGLVKAVATQNVDGFHQLAGSHNVHELHGSIRSVCCSECDHPASTERFLDQSKCQQCDGKLRPNVTLFDESLPSQAWEGALKAIVQSDLVIAIGTSLNVYPANRLPSMTEGRTVVINLEPTMMDEKFNLVIHGKSEEIHLKVDKWIGRL